MGAGVRGRVEQCRYYGHDAVLQIRPEQPSGPAQQADVERARDGERAPDGELLLARVHGEQALPIGTRVTVAARGPVSALR